MFAIYATHAAPDDPLSALKLGDLPEPSVPDGWVRVKVSHASLNRHDLFTLQGVSGHTEGINYPIILGNDAAGTLDDGTPVVIYPMMGSDNWRRDETLDPQWHIPSEIVHGTFADYAVVPRRNAAPESAARRFPMAHLGVRSVRHASWPCLPHVCHVCSWALRMCLNILSITCCG